MALKTINDSLLSEIAGAIRAKTGSQDLILPSEMSAKIQSIEGSGSGGDTERELFIPNSDMLWAKQILVEDVEANSGTYKGAIIQMILDGSPYSEFTISEGDKVVTSDGSEYTESTTHVWDDTNARDALAYTGYKTRWVIYYIAGSSNYPKILYNTIYFACVGDSYSYFKPAGCIFLEYFDDLNDNGESVTYTGDGLFEGCSSLQALPNLNFTNVNSFINMFKDCNNLWYVPDINCSGAKTFEGMFYNCKCLKIAPNINTSGAYNFTNMFAGCTALIKVPVYDTSSGTDFSGMFAQCYSLKDFPLIDTSKGVTFSSMYSSCFNLLENPKIDTSSGTNFSSMFSSTKSITKVEGLDFSNATNISYMFSGCSALGSVQDISSNKITSAANIFNGCERLDKAPKINTSLIKSFSGMFSGCNSLYSIKGIDMSSATSIGSFVNADRLEELEVSNIKKSISLSYAPKLSYESLIGVLNNLVDLTGSSSQTLTLGSTNMQKLTEDDKLIATNKNWVLK